MLKLYKMEVDCGRSGELSGLFVSPSSPVGLYCEFGEVLGKHSDVSGTIEESEITVVSEDQDKIEWLVDLLGYSLSGYNPFDYSPAPTCEECGDEEGYCECEDGFQIEE